MATTPAEAAETIREYFVALNADRQQFRDWEAGTITGGPNGNGTYPLTDFTGNTYAVRCPARIIFDTNRTLITELTGANAYTLTAAHFGRKLRVTAPSGTAVLTLPADAPIETTIVIRGVAPTKVRLAVAAPGAIYSWLGHNGTGGPGAALVATCEADAGGGSALWVIDGATGIV